MRESQVYKGEIMDRGEGKSGIFPEYTRKESPNMECKFLKSDKGDRNSHNH